MHYLLFGELQMGSSGQQTGLIAFALSLAGIASDLAACPAHQVAIETATDAVIVAVEIADDPQERADGLSGRESLEPGTGMLFLYDTPHRAWFWMMGTRIALDMIFIEPDGTISAIKREVQPGTLLPKSGGPNTLSVLEINGGESDAYGIRVGDQVQRFTEPCSN